MDCNATKLAQEVSVTLVFFTLTCETSTEVCSVETEGQFLYVDTFFKPKTDKCSVKIRQHRGHEGHIKLTSFL